MHNPRELSKLVHQNLEVVQSFISETVGGPTEVEADRALHEMAAQLRLLDDVLGLGRDLRAGGFPPLGTVVQQGGERLDLYFRDMTNKVMHASKFEWSVSESSAVICIGKEDGRWQSAEIRLAALKDLCDRLL